MTYLYAWMDFWMFIGMPFVGFTILVMTPYGCIALLVKYLDWRKRNGR